MINLLHLGQKHSYLMDQFKKDKKKKKIIIKIIKNFNLMT